MRDSVDVSLSQCRCLALMPSHILIVEDVGKRAGKELCIRGAGSYYVKSWIGEQAILTDPSKKHCI